MSRGQATCGPAVPRSSTWHGTFVDTKIREQETSRSAVQSLLEAGGLVIGATADEVNSRERPTSASLPLTDLTAHRQDTHSPGPWVPAVV